MRAADWWDQVETDHNNEIAREVAMQKQLASSFKLAVCARAFWCVLELDCDRCKLLHASKPL